MTFSDLMRFTDDILETLGIPFAVVGSVASGFWGEGRSTQDVDIVIDLKPRQIDQLIASYPEDDFYVSRAAVTEAVSLSRPFNVIHNQSGFKIDFMVVEEGSWGKSQLQRRQQVEVMPNVRTMVAAPEDVILGKLIYYQEGGSDKHIRDIAHILQVSGAIIDHDYLNENVRRLKLSEVWEAILQEIERLSS